MIASLRTRLLLAIGALAVTAIVAVAISARQTTRVEFERFENLERTAADVDADPRIDDIAAILNGRCCADAVLDRAGAALPPGHALLVIDGAGSILAARGLADGVRAEDLRATVTGDELRISGKAVGERASSASVNEGLAIVVRGAPSKTIANADGGPATLYVMRQPREAHPGADFLNVVDRRLLATTGLVAALALAAAWFVSRRMLQPIAELRAATRDLGRGDLTRRVSASGDDELAELARGFNAMAVQLQRQEDLRRGLVHDVAHELRTPLTALRCRIESAIDGLGPEIGPALKQMNEEVAHLSQLVSDLEDLAQAEAGDIRLVTADVDLGELCASALRATGLDDDPRVVLDVPLRVVAHGDAVRLRQIIANVLTNASRHTPPDGRITVRAIARGAEAVIEIHNTGSTLAPEELVRVFDRFYRVDPSRQRATGGRGLGLAIVKHLTEAQGGHAWATSDASSVTIGVSVPAA